MLLLEDSDMEELLAGAEVATASKGSGSNRADTAAAKDDCIIDPAVQSSGGGNSLHQTTAEPRVAQACPDGNPTGRDCGGRERPLHFLPAKRRCYDDFKLDELRVNAKRRPLDDLQLDRKRIRAATSESEPLAALSQLYAQDAPT
jgi:hypothetical protein